MSRRAIAIELARAEAEAHVVQRSRGEGSAEKLVAQGLGPTCERSIYLRLPRDCNGMNRAYVVTFTDIAYYPPAVPAKNTRMESGSGGMAETLEGALACIEQCLEDIP